MPRMQVYLPDALYRQVKERGLPASELLQEAVAAELRRQELEARADEYIADLGTKARKGSAVDALVVAIAEPGSTVLTSDGDDLRALAANAADVSIEII